MNPSRAPGSTYWRNLRLTNPDAFEGMPAAINRARLKTINPRALTVGATIENGRGLRRKITSGFNDGRSLSWVDPSTDTLEKRYLTWLSKQR